MLAPARLDLFELQQLGARPHQLPELLAVGFRRPQSRRSVHASIIAEQLRIDAVGLRQSPRAAGVIAHPLGRHDADRHPGRLRRGDQRGFVAAGGFAHQVGSGRQAPQRLRNRLGGVGELMGGRRQIDIQPGLGDVDADVFDRGGVHGSCSDW
jgi:hypothetical protein